MSHEESNQQSSHQQVTLPAYQGPQLQNKQLADYKPISGTPQEVIARFPPRHSCQYCKEELINAFKARPYPPPYLRGKTGAIKAAQDGCKLYNWLLYFFFRSNSPEHHGFYLQRSSLKNHYDISEVGFLIGTENYTWSCASFEVFADADNPAASYISTRPFNADVGSAASFKSAKRWLEECYNNHKKCCSPERGFLPTRLLDMSSCSHINHVKITSNFETISKAEALYATLSYCWGGEEFVKMTKSSLAEHQTGIEISCLGQTIRDAIKATRSLGLRFLWVDSLCIIQDDPDDMAKEISRMSAYYENGHVSICASVAARCSEGFLARRTKNPYYHGPFELPCRNPPWAEGSVNLVQYREYSGSLEPVRSRAWIMQESLLAPRLLSYSYQSVAWSCRSVNRNDGGPRREWHEWHDFKDRKTWNDLQDQRSSRFDKNSPLQKWKDLVASFTSKSLTDSKDRLPAISGIAQKYALILRKHFSDVEMWPEWIKIRELPQWKEFAYASQKPTFEFFCIEYMTGLWWCKSLSEAVPLMFYEQLLWTTPFYNVLPTLRSDSDSSRPSLYFESRLGRAMRSAGLGSNSEVVSPGALKSPSSQTYIAPSWSWAAVEGPIHFEGVGVGRELHNCLPVTNEFELLECGVELELPGAPFGKIRSGRLKVKGRMIRFPDLSICDKHEQYWRVVYRPDTAEAAAKVSQLMRGWEGGQGWLLLITGQGETAAKPKDQNWTVNTPKGLILGEEGENYRRLGMFSMERFRPWTGNPIGVLNYEQGLFASSGHLQTVTII